MTRDVPIPAQGPALSDPSGSGPTHWVDTGEWQGLFDRANPQVRAVVADIVKQHTPALADTFYDTLLADRRALPFLSHGLVAERLHASLQRWLITMFDDQATDIPAMMQLQQHVGQVHARVQLPITLVSRGARILKDAISGYLRRSRLDRTELSLAQQYVGGMFDLALEVMSTAYLRDSRREVRAGEAYRLFSLGQNIAAERESQRAALLEWAQRILLQLHLPQVHTTLPSLRRAEFGLWMYHKGGATFEGTLELPEIWEAIGRLDTDIVPQLQSAMLAKDTNRLAELAQQFHEHLDQIQFLLNRLFERVGEIESGRDPLTQLLNRRFVSTVLSREISLARQQAGQFGLLMLDLDYFKEINDRYGHNGGDAVLRQVAELLLKQCRSGDYVFRYGGEEFLIVLVDLEADKLDDIAEKLRLAIAEHEFRLPDGQRIHITSSLGGAMHDGHPDPQHLIQMTDQRLYAAKHAGRNRIVLREPPFFNGPPT